MRTLVNEGQRRDFHNIRPRLYVRCSECRELKGKVGRLSCTEGSTKVLTPLAASPCRGFVPGTRERW